MCNDLNLSFVGSGAKTYRTANQIEAHSPELCHLDKRPGFGGWSHASPSLTSDHHTLCPLSPSEVVQMLKLKFSLLVKLRGLKDLPSGMLTYLDHAMAPETWTEAPHNLIGLDESVLQMAKFVRALLDGDHDRVLQIATNNGQKVR